MKKIIILRILGIIALSVLLTGCLGSNGGDEKEKAAIGGFKSYSAENFEIQIPEAWEILTPEKFQSNISKNTIAAFRSNIRNPIFTPNIVISKNELSSEISSSDYAKALNQKLSNDLSSFRERSIEKTDVNINGKTAETLFIFVEGQEREDSDLKWFMGKAAVKGKNAYVITGALLANEENAAQEIEKIVRSFEVK